jgi:hypothetical protein
MLNFEDGLTSWLGHILFAVPRIAASVAGPSVWVSPDVQRKVIIRTDLLVYASVCGVLFEQNNSTFDESARRLLLYISRRLAAVVRERVNKRGCGSAKCNSSSSFVWVSRSPCKHCLKLRGAMFCTLRNWRIDCCACTRSACLAVVDLGSLLLLIASARVRSLKSYAIS